MPMSDSFPLTEFRERYVEACGLNSVTAGDYSGAPAIIAMVENAANFDATSLPEGFMGHAVLINDGNHVRQARGPIV